MASRTTVDLEALDSVIEKVEFKYTLASRDMPRVRQMLGTGATRKVFFYDTEDLDLRKAQLVLRFRTTEGDKDNTTVKRRPVDLAVDGPALREIDGIEFEADKVGDELKIAAKLDDKSPAGSADPSEPVTLFQEQRPLLNGFDLTTVRRLGPVNALKWELQSFEGFPFKLDVEEWNVDDELVFLELSFKVDRPAAADAQPLFIALLERLQLDPDEPQATKTDQVLEHFTARL